jgi:hypothetical protein
VLDHMWRTLAHFGGRLLDGESWRCRADKSIVFESSADPMFAQGQMRKFAVEVRTERICKQLAPKLGRASARAQARRDALHPASATNILPFSTVCSMVPTRRKPTSGK